MTTCYHCSISNDSLVIECSICNKHIHQMCLFNANCLPEKWINSNTPSKAVLQIFNSVNFAFRCTSCIDNISIDNQSQSIISDISTSSILNYESSNIDTITDTTNPTYTHINKPTLQSISDDITEIKRLLTNTNKPTYADKLIKSTNDMIKTNLNVTNKINLLPIAPDSFSIVIENIRKLNSNNNIINSMFTQMQLNTNLISKVKYNLKNIEISFNSHYAQSIFISSIHCLKQSVYSKLFIRKSVDNKTLIHGKILYHAIKSKYVLYHKCVFNRFSNTYELRSINSHTKRIDWSVNPLLISDDNIEKYKNSYNSYISNIQINTSSQNKRVNPTKRYSNLPNTIIDKPTWLLNDKYIKCALINARSIKANIEILSDFITEFNHDIIAITETWLTHDFTPLISQLINDTYIFKHTPRNILHENKTGGGIGILFKKSMKLISYTNILSLVLNAS